MRIRRASRAAAAVVLLCLALSRIEAQNTNALLMRAELPPIGSGAVPDLARDTVRGNGFFDSAVGPGVFGWPVVVCGESAYHVIFLDRDQHLYYSRISPWPVWPTPARIDSPAPSPGYPTHNLAASKTHPKVAVTWVCEDTTGPKPAYYRISTDGGVSWSTPVQLDTPHAYSADTLTSFHLSSIYPFWDSRDTLHVVAAVHPMIHDTGYTTPAQIWHWSRGT